MKLGFEVWLDSQRQTISAEAKAIFDESIICYKASAYRGAYILSYLGFITMVRERLLVSGPPSPELLPDQSKWKDIQEELRKPESWDIKVNNLIGMDNSGTDKNIFLISKSVRKDAVHFKDKRNDCAHGKDIVSYPHVESLWMFIQNHSGKFMVNGGVEGYVQLVESHFNPAENDPTADFTELLNILPSVVHSEGYGTLFSKLFQVVTMRYRSRSYYKNFWISLLESDEAVRGQLLNYLKDDLDDLEGFIFAYPKLIRFYNDDNQTLRKIWHRIIPIAHISDENVSNLYEITSWLLENQKIPPAELPDLWNKWIKSETLKWVGDVLTPQFVELLRRYGYFEAYRNHIMNASNAGSNYKFWYDQEQLLPIYLQYAELDSDLVQHINAISCNLRSSGSFKDRISKTLNADGGKLLSQYHKYCDELGIRSYY